MNLFRRIRLFFVLTCLWLVSGAAVLSAGELDEPQVNVDGAVYSFTDSFETPLDPHVVLDLLFTPDSLAKIDGKTASALDFVVFSDTCYDAITGYHYLGFYKNRITVRRVLNVRGGRVRSELVEFTQTLGVAPDPLRSETEYQVTCEGGVTRVLFTQRTEFRGKLGKLANHVFVRATLDYLRDVKRYVLDHKMPENVFVEAVEVMR